MMKMENQWKQSTVAPYLGAWIEIELPFMYNLVSDVAPYLGAWIEIVAEELYYTVSRGRTLPGCVD